jgi:hypothetical protein
VHQVPTLMLLTRRTTVNMNRIDRDEQETETIVYEPENSVSATSLLQFVIFNTRNLDLLTDLLNDLCSNPQEHHRNVISTSSLKRAILTKLSFLEHKYINLNRTLDTLNQRKSHLSLEADPMCPQQQPPPSTNRKQMSQNEQNKKTYLSDNTDSLLTLSIRKRLDSYVHEIGLLRKLKCSV